MDIQTRSKADMSNKQRVLKMFPGATCNEVPVSWAPAVVKTGHFQVNYGNGKTAEIGGSPSSAWAHALRELGASNALETHTPFMLGYEEAARK